MNTPQTLEQALKLRTIGAHPVEIERVASGQHIRAVCVNKPRTYPRLKCLRFNARLDTWQITVYKVIGNYVEFEGYAPAATTDESADEFRALLNQADELVRWAE